MTDYLPCTVLVAISLVGFPSSDKLIIVLYVTPKFPRKQEKNKIYTNESIVYFTNTQSGYAYALYDRQMDANVYSQYSLYNLHKYRNILKLEFTHIWDTASHKQTNHRFSDSSSFIYSSVIALVSFIVQW